MPAQSQLTSQQQKTQDLLKRLETEVIAFELASEVDPSKVIDGSLLNEITHLCISDRKKVDTQKWRLQPVADGYYAIVSKLDVNKAIDLYNKHTRDDNPICIYQFHGEHNQQWKFEVLADGSCSIVSRLDNNKVFDLHRSQTKNGSPVQIFRRNHTSAQQWRIIPEEPEKIDFSNEKQTFSHLNLKEGLTIKGEIPFAYEIFEIHPQNGTCLQRTGYKADAWTAVVAGYHIEQQKAFQEASGTILPIVDGDEWYIWVDTIRPTQVAILFIRNEMVNRVSYAGKPFGLSNK